MATSTGRTLQLVERQSQQRASIALALLKALLGLWGGFDQWGNRDMVSAYAAKSASLVDVSLAKTRRNVRSFSLQVLADHGATPARVRPQVDLYPRSGTPSTQVYARPAEQYNYARSQGKSDAEARTVMEKRLTDLVAADVAAAERDEFDQMWAMSSKVIGYRRIIHPERSVSGTCGLCVVAATRLYSTDDLMELHGGCKCTELPVFKDSDPGLKLNTDDLKEIYAAAGSTAAEDLKRTRVAIDENGELGPILVREGDHFRDVHEVNRTGSGKTFTAYQRPTKENQTAAWQASIVTSQRAIAALEKARDAGTNNVDLGSGRATSISNIAQAIKFHRDLIDRMKSKLR